MLRGVIRRAAVMALGRGVGSWRWVALSARRPALSLFPLFFPSSPPSLFLFPSPPLPSLAGAAAARRRNFFWRWVVGRQRWVVTGRRWVVLGAVARRWVDVSRGVGCPDVFVAGLVPGALGGVGWRGGDEGGADRSE